MNRVIHLIPYHAIGGVECAALTMDNFSNDSFSFSVTTIFSDVNKVTFFMLWNPLPYILCLLSLLRYPPKVLIVSLWRAYAVGIALKLLRPNTRMVVFLHLPKHVHLVDRLLTTVAASFSSRVWADSSQTLRFRLPNLPSSKSRVISFLTQRTIPVYKNEHVRPVFIFWGRLHKQKGLKRSIRLFASIHKHYPDAKYLIIGPDGGCLDSLKNLVKMCNLCESVHFLGPMNFAEIRQIAAYASFYLQTSEVEGMAMSVVEAMQMGLVPIVAPAGEISNYLKSGINGFAVTKDQHTVDYVVTLLQDPSRFKVLRNNALSTWNFVPLYKDDVVEACEELLFNV